MSKRALHLLRVLTAGGLTISGIASAKRHGQFGICLFLLSFACARAGVLSDDGVWELAPEAARERQRVVRLDHGSLEALLASASREFSREHPQMAFHLPRPDGTFERFAIAVSPIMEPELAAKFPNIRTYAGKSLDDPTATMRLCVSAKGLNAQAPRGAWYVQPLERGEQQWHKTYYKREAIGTGRACSTTAFEINAAGPAALAATEAGPMFVAAATGPALRVFRLAVAAQAEYSIYHGGTIEGVMSAIATTVNNVNGVYESEFAVRLPCGRFNTSNQHFFLVSVG